MRAILRKDGVIVSEGTIPDNPNHSNGRFTLTKGNVPSTREGYTLILDDGTEREISITRVTSNTNDTVANYTNQYPA